MGQYCYKIVDGELKAKAMEGANAPEGWWEGNQKFSDDAREKARAGLHALNPVVPGNGTFKSRRSRKKRT